MRLSLLGQKCAIPRRLPVFFAKVSKLSEFRPKLTGSPSRSVPISSSARMGDIHGSLSWSERLLTMRCHHYRGLTSPTGRICQFLDLSFMFVKVEVSMPEFAATRHTCS